MLISRRPSTAALLSFARPLRRSVVAFVACAALALTMVLTTVLVLPAGHARATTTTMVSSTTYRAQLLAGVNAERTKRGLPALRLSSCLNDTYAQPWAIYLAIHHTLVHQSMSKMLTGCHASVAAEDIGAGAVSAASMVKLWMGSASHRANILSTHLRYIGVGAAHSGSTVWYSVLDFSG
ncbi:MAG: CAP domain-containing protein [Actinomycetales bacterium]